MTLQQSATSTSQRQRAEELARVLFGSQASVEVLEDEHGASSVSVADLDDRRLLRESQRAWIANTVDIALPGRWRAIWSAVCDAVTFERVEEPAR